MRDVVSMYEGTQRLNLSSGTVPKNNTNSVAHGSDVNLAGYDGAMFYFIPILYTDGTHTFVIEEADDNGSGSAGSYSTVANADLVAWSATSTTDFTPSKLGNQQPTAYSSAGTFLYQRVGYIGNKQWVRCSVTPSAATTGASYIVISEPNRPRKSPAYV
jgi:hypothetical protein